GAPLGRPGLGLVPRRRPGRAALTRTAGVALARRPGVPLPAGLGVPLARRPGRPALAALSRRGLAAQNLGDPASDLVVDGAHVVLNIDVHLFLEDAQDLLALHPQLASQLIHANAARQTAHPPILRPASLPRRGAAARRRRPGRGPEPPAPRTALARRWF